MLHPKERFEKAIQKIDEYNKKDPNTEYWKGKVYPKEYLYSLRMSEHLDQYQPDASEALKIAARSHHIGRWEIPRSDYPEGKTGYYQWRTTLQGFHAEIVEEILQELEFDTGFIEKVKKIIQKKEIKKDLEVQILEDVICHVFLLYYLEPFAQPHAEEKVVDILQKTLKKMSAHGKEVAMSLPLTREVASLLKKID